jgi:hypothetical protein
MILELTFLISASAIPKLVLAFAVSAYPILGNVHPRSTPYIEKAKNKIIDAIGNANHNKSINLDQKYLNYFNRIGKGLLEDESIDFSPESDKGAILNKNVRKKILLSRNEKYEYSDSITFNASIPSVDKKEGKFKLDIDGNSIECNFDVAGDFYKTILAAFNEYENNTLVSIKATGIYNEQDKLIRIEGMEAMDVLDPYDVNVRLSQLSKLADNWYDGTGKAPNSDLLKQFGEYFGLYYNQELPLPSIFPTIEGGIQLEWSFHSSGVILEVNDNFMSNFLISYDDNDSIVDNQLNLTKQEDWAELNDQIKNLVQ